MNNKQHYQRHSECVLTPPAMPNSPLKSRLVRPRQNLTGSSWVHSCSQADVFLLCQLLTFKLVYCMQHRCKLDFIQFPGSRAAGDGV